ncbi:F-box domain [Heracleum sosnowskyi]|uniref:F-box domain n=1 Tax=Heracleum sosnowskyi TaxID=360622 RepID=A0AAD8J9C1_9APIA|nr:F-box domain [Heracleum sosnowskyi]
MIKMGTKRSRTSKTISPVSRVPDLKLSSPIESAARVASSEDLLIQILLHVPVKTLLNFKSVSKQWLSLINSPHFLRLCSLRLCSPLSPSVSSLFFASSSSCRSNPDYQFIPLDINDKCPTPFKTLDFTNDPLGSGISALQSCNGLLLCASYRAREFNRTYYVYNPTTKHFVILPRIRHQYSKFVCGMSLAFDPRKSPYYKVVCVRRSETSRQLFQIEIYSSETLSWRVSGESFNAPKHTEFQNSIYWNGSVHWWNGSFHWWNGFANGGQQRNETYTLYFKVDEESIEQLPVSEKRYGDYYVASYVGESDGHFHLVEGNYDYNRSFNVHEMAIDYSGWFIKYKVDLSALANAFPEMMKKNRFFGYTVKIISLVRRGKEEEEEDGSFLVLEIPGGKIIRYNLVDKSAMKLWEFAPGHKFYNDDCLRHVCALPYI